MKTWNSFIHETLTGEDGAEEKGNKDTLRKAKDLGPARKKKKKKELGHNKDTVAKGVPGSKKREKVIVDPEIYKGTHQRPPMNMF